MATVCSTGCAPHTGEGTVYVALSNSLEFVLLGNVAVGTKCSGDQARVDWGDFNGDGNDDWLCYSSSGSSWDVPRSPCPTAPA